MRTMKPEDVALAAFLHDIGKFWWPATGRRRPEEINAWLDYLPSDHSGRPTHLHAAYSAAFVSKFVSDDTLARTVASHHKPSTREEWTVAVADRLASGERQVVTSDLVAPDPGQARILSPFKDDHYLPLMRRSGCANPDLTEKFHPATTSQHAPGTMERAWGAFIADIQALGRGPLTDPGTWMELLREHTARLPAQSPTAKGPYQPSISIFDHSRMSAAIAHVLAGSSLGDDEIQALPLRRDPAMKPFSVVIGDLSGVQAFLYTGSTAKAIRALKGRSFFLQFLTERFSSLARDALGLTPFADLFTGGGRFVLIGPGGLDLTELRIQVEEILLDVFGGQIGFALAETDFGPLDLTAEGQSMGQVLLRAGRKLNTEKRRRFRTSAAGSYDKVFAPYTAANECQVCRAPTENAQQETCVLCEEFISLGTRLRKAKYLIEHTPDRAHPLYRIGRVFEPEEDLLAEPLRSYLENRARILQLNGFDARELAHASALAPSGERPTVGARLLGVRIPEDPYDQTVVPFEELARQSSGDTNHIAIVREDVDNLGTLFHNVPTLSELATLSRSVADFFDGRVTAILDHDDLRDSTYLVYAGGDDLLLAGAWDAAIEAAARVRDEFVRYTGGVRTLSAGIEVVHPRFPLRRGADAAGLAEQNAKALRPEKDAACLLGTPLPWEALGKVRELTDMVAAEVAQGSPRRLVSRLREIWWAYKKGRDELAAEGDCGASLNRAARWYRWRWLLVYSLRTDAGKQAKAIQERLLDEGMEMYLGLVARLSELATRR